MSPLLRLPLPTFGLLLPLAVCGAVFARRNRRACLLALFALVYAASVIAFFNMSRYRIPLLPALYVLAAAGVFELARRLRARRLRSALPALLFLALAYPAVYQEISPRNFARVHANMGVAHALRAEAAELEARELGEAGEAGAAEAARRRADELWELCEAEYRKALDLQPHQVSTRRALRTVLDARAVAALDAGELERARDRATVATTTFPGAAEGHALLGAALARLGETARARAEITLALSLDPHNARARAERQRLSRAEAAPPP